MNHQPTSAASTSNETTLWVSAFIIIALIIICASRYTTSTAHADMAVNADEFTLLTVDSGRGEDAAPDELLYVIDSRSETVYVYEVDDARNGSILLRGGGSLSNLFTNASR